MAWRCNFPAAWHGWDEGTENDVPWIANFFHVQLEVEDYPRALDYGVANLMEFMTMLLTAFMVMDVRSFFRVSLQYLSALYDISTYEKSISYNFYSIPLKTS